MNSHPIALKIILNQYPFKETHIWDTHYRDVDIYKHFKMVNCSVLESPLIKISLYQCLRTLL